MSHAPKRGDVLWLAIDPQAGHEQAGDLTSGVVYDYLRLELNPEQKTITIRP